MIYNYNQGTNGKQKGAETKETMVITQIVITPAGQ